MQAEWPHYQQGIVKVLTLSTGHSLTPPQWGYSDTSLQSHRGGSLSSPPELCWQRWKLGHNFLCVVFGWSTAFINLKVYYLVKLPFSLRKQAFVGVFDIQRNENNSPLCCSMYPEISKQSAFFSSPFRVVYLFNIGYVGFQFYLVGEMGEHASTSSSWKLEVLELSFLESLVFEVNIG